MSEVKNNVDESINLLLELHNNGLPTYGSILELKERLELWNSNDGVLKPIKMENGCSISTFDDFSTALDQVRQFIPEQLRSRWGRTKCFELIKWIIINSSLIRKSSDFRGFDELKKLSKEANLISREWYIYLRNKFFI